MIKSISFLQRKPGLSREEFVRHWLDVHVQMCHVVPGLRGYSVSTIVEHQSRPDVPSLAMGRVRWRRPDVVRQRRGEGGGCGFCRRQALARRRRQHHRRHPHVRDQRATVPAPPPTASRPKFKALSVIKRKAELSAQQFQHEWAVVHAPMARGVPGLRGFTRSPKSSRSSSARIFRLSPWMVR